MSISIIYLVGFMGAGKTSVGSKLAERLGWTFTDLDREIEKRAGTAITELFRNRGESYFRILERRELERVSMLSSAVIALGGGAFCDAENRRIIARTGTSIWLDAPLEWIYSRFEGDHSRPLAGTRREMEKLYNSRTPYYAMASFRVEIGCLTIDEIAQEIFSLLRKSGLI